MRKMSKSWEYPGFVRPFELVQYPDHDFEPACKDDFNRRLHDICFIGGASPWRANLACSILTYNQEIFADFFFPFHRIEHEDWLNRHRAARWFIEADGGGFGSERPYQLITIAPMARMRNDQRMAHPWTDGVNCIEIGDTWGRISGEDGSKLWMSGDISHGIYLAGIQHMHDHYFPAARSAYLLEQMANAGIS